jgi:hypothetical protein
MKNKKQGLKLKKTGFSIASAVLFMVFLSCSVFSVPQGPTVTSNTTESASVSPGLNITTAGGSFTTLVLNITMQNFRWKAYIGNVTGKLTLDDARNSTIYDWTLATVTGEVYSTRASSTPDWGNIGCASDSVLSQEETALSITTSSEDSINNTFSSTTHKSFEVAGVSITNSSCRAISTYVNDSSQSGTESDLFQEVLLDDNTNIIYTTILEQDASGYSNAPLDFQMIVADVEGSSSTTYYFYVEIG